MYTAMAARRCGAPVVLFAFRPQKLVQLGVNNSIVIPSLNAQLPECFAEGYALIRHLVQGPEKQQL
jgi:hypothetical protein